MDDWWGHFWAAVQAIGALLALAITIGLFALQSRRENHRLERRIKLLAEAGRDMMNELLKGSDTSLALWLSERKPLIWRDLIARLDAIPMERIAKDQVQQAMLSLAVIFRDAEWLHAEVGILDGRVNAHEKMTELRTQVDLLLKAHF